MPANREARLERREPLAGPYVILTFAHPETALEARAGQFVMLKPGRSPEPPLRRPFSIMSVDRDASTFSVFVKAVGTVTRGLATMEPGESALCTGPLGRPFTMPPEGAAALMVAGGYGIAPFVLFTQQLHTSGCSGRVFYGGRSVADLQLEGRFGPLGIPLTTTTEDGSRGRRGLVTDAVEDHLARTSERATLYACGPDPMLAAVARLAVRHDLHAEVSLDPWMGCGIGLCLSCVVDIQEPGAAAPRYRCACTDGPVFDARHVVWRGEGAAAGNTSEGRR
jgi:dihydroorotate dehydrogenase electron transfer subunit